MFLMTDPDKAIVGLLIGLFFLPSILAIVLFWAGLTFGVRAFMRGNTGRAVALLCVALVVPAIFLAKRSSAHFKAQVSASTSHATSRTGPIRDWPRVLAIDGKLHARDAAKLLALRDLDEVRASIGVGLVGADYTGTRFQLHQSCRQTLKDALLAKQSIEPIVAKCTIASPLGKEPLLSLDRMLVLSTSGKDTTSQGGVSIARMELSLFENGRSTLIDARESLGARMPSAPWLITWHGFHQSTHSVRDNTTDQVNLVLQNLKQ
jgi:hypothetical protein